MYFKRKALRTPMEGLAYPVLNSVGKNKCMAWIFYAALVTAAN